MDFNKIETVPVQTNSIREKYITLSIIIIAIVLSIWVGTLTVAVPSPVDASAPAEIFSSERALKHLEKIAEVPHGTGTSANKEVRDYIIGELKYMGLPVEVQNGEYIDAWENGEYFTGININNIIAKLKGSESGRAVLVVAHYDSMLQTYGAFDDGAAVSSMLESIRALKTGPKLKNDIVFLFTDGEEINLAGANMFVKEHQWAKDAGLVLNFEARGNSGPYVMFETSPGNGRLVNEFADAVPYPAAFSVSYDLYKYIPNDTDFTVFKNAGMPGLNFACVDGYQTYHMEIDSVENINQGTLQQQGANLLSMIRHFGNMDIGNVVSDDSVYFTLPGFLLVCYPQTANIILTIIAIMLFIVFMVLMIKRKMVSVLKSLIGFASSIILSAITAGFAAGAWKIIESLSSRDIAYYIERDSGFGIFYFASIIVLGLLVFMMLGGIVNRKIGLFNFTAGGLLVWCILAAASNFVLPGGNYLFVWPLIFAAINLLKFNVINKNILVNRAIVLALYIIPTVILFYPVIYAVYVTLTLSWVAIVMVLVSMLFILLIPAIFIIEPAGKWTMPSAFGILAIIVICLGVFNLRIDSKHPAQNVVHYGLNNDTGEAVFFSTDSKIDGWTVQYLGSDGKAKVMSEYIPQMVSSSFYNDAPEVPIMAPQLEVLCDNQDGNNRTLSLKLTSPRGASQLRLYMPENLKILEASLNGKPFKLSLQEDFELEKYEYGFENMIFKSGTYRLFEYYAPSEEGVVFAIKFVDEGTVDFRLTDVSYGLPESLFIPRPDNMMCHYIPSADMTYVTRLYKF